MAVVNFLVLVSSIFLVGFIVGLHNVLTDFEENKCEMTYMFEYPQYVKISFSGKVEKQYPRYGLYAYGEGQRTEKIRQMRFDGIPVLFIPGNSGSHRQMRSLASVSLRKSIDSRTPFHFDYFAVDLNEEYSALFGGVLEDQTRFTRLAIVKILGLYKSLPESPTSVVLVGHSLGGLIAKAVLISPSFDATLVRIVLAISAPLAAPALSADWLLADVYHRVEREWRPPRPARLDHVTLVSIAGGTRDVQVRSGLARDPAADVSVQTTGIPGVWLSTDHLCSVWCKQLVLVLVRALFDMVSIADRQITGNATERLRVFNYHLVQRSSGKHAAAHPATAALDREAEWFEDNRRQYGVTHSGGVQSTRHIMVRITADPKYQRLAVQAVYLNPRDWIFACAAHSVHHTYRVCSDDAVNLSGETQIAPSLRYRRKMAYLDMAALRARNFTHVVVRIPPTTDFVQLHVDSYSTLLRQVVAPLPRWLSTSARLVMAQTPPSATHLQVLLPGLTQPHQAYRLRLRPACAGVGSHHATATLVVPWSREQVHAHATETQEAVLPIRLQTARPPGSDSETASVTLVLDPACRYSVHIESAIVDSLGQMVRFYAAQMPAFVAVVLLLAWRQQIASLSAEGSERCMSLHSALCGGAKPYFLLPAVKMAAKLLGGGAVAMFLDRHQLLPDSVYLQAQNLDLFALPFALYLASFALVYLAGLALWVAVLVMSHSLHKMAVRLVSGWLLGAVSWSEWILAGLARLPAVVAAVLATLALNTCGALALALAAIFYLFKLCKMHEDYLEARLFKSLAVLAGRRGGPDPTLSSTHFHTTGALLWLLVAALNAPAALVWAHNYSFGSQLSPDPSFETGFVLCVCAGLLWQGEKPTPRLRHTKLVCHGLFALSALVLVFAQVSLHRLSALVTAAFVLVALHQTLASAEPAQEPAQEDALAAGDASAAEKKDN